MSDAYAGWAIVELMGHRQRAGLVAEVDMYGGKLMRIDLPTEDGGFVTEYVGGSAIYALHPCTEALARDRARRQGDPRPVQPLDYRLPAPAPDGAQRETPNDGDYDDA